MEKYIKLSDVVNLLDKMTKEPGYQHVGEDWYTGVYSVSTEIYQLPTTILDEHFMCAEWISDREGFLDSDYGCSACGKLADEGNSGHFNTLTPFCKNCGRKMKIGGKHL